MSTLSSAIVWNHLSVSQRSTLAQWFDYRTVAPERLDDALNALAVACVLAVFPGTGVVRSPENAPSREDGAAPVPDPAHICADDDETNERPERPERAMPPWRASHQRT